MKRRIEKKVERHMLVDRVCELQRQICEYERFCGDLLVMLCKGEAQCVLQHSGIMEGEWIWNRVEKLIKENAELREKVGIDFEGIEPKR